MKKAHFILYYFVFLIPSLILFSTLWFYFMADKLFYLTDKLPVISMLPPFIDPQFGEYFLVPPVIAYLAALLWWIVILYIPYFFTKKIVQERKRKS